MSQTIQAAASPEKRLFISLLTRDIPLIAAFLDLVDNSVNAAVEPTAERLRNAPGYQELYQDQSIKRGVDIRLRLSSKEVTISDTAGGISATDAENHVFRFGRATEATHVRDRLSVYGIGLKRAMFKLGRVIKIRSDHVQGGFRRNVDVDKWTLYPHPPLNLSLT